MTKGGSRHGRLRTHAVSSGMDTAAQDVREMLQMAALLKGAAARAVFRLNSISSVSL